MRLPAISTEACIGILLGLLAWVVELTWEIRGLFTLIAAGLAVHIAKRLDYRLLTRVAIGAVTIGLLLLGTYKPIWAGFHDDFPEVGSGAALSRIIQFSVVTCCAIAGYIFLVRPWGRKGYRVLPAQLIAFGAIVVATGFVPIAVGLVWLFSQNWTNGVSPTGAPLALAAGPQPLQIAQAPSQPALPAPTKKDTQYVAGYSLTEEGVRALTAELYKLKDSLKHIDVQRLVTDLSSGGLWTGINQACDRAGLECSIGPGHLNSPDDRGIKIYVTDMNNPPESAKKLQGILERLGLHSPFASHTANVATGPDTFILFLGPAP
jgi:hypothetical protein